MSPRDALGGAPETGCGPLSGLLSSWVPGSDKPLPEAETLTSLCDSQRRGARDLEGTSQPTEETRQRDHR